MACPKVINSSKILEEEYLKNGVSLWNSLRQWINIHFRIQKHCYDIL